MCLIADGNFLMLTMEFNMALVRPSTPGNHGCHYIYETADDRGIPGLMVDDKFYPLERLKSMVHLALVTKESLPWNRYVSGKVALWVIDQIEC